MKTIKLSILSALFLLIATVSFAQEKKETIKVAGECGMCKKKIEKAAKDGGATYAVWNQTSKNLVVKYNSTSSNTAKIEQSIANSGYDTPKFKATEEAYKSLEECCQYDRTAMGKAKNSKCGTDKEKCSKDSKDCCKKKTTKAA